MPAADSVFITLWLNVRHSALIRYFTFVIIETDVFQIPQLYKHVNVRCL